MNSSEPRLNVLVAYPYLTPRLEALLYERRAELRLLVDSGAFTAFQLKVQIPLAAYCHRLERLRITPWRYFVLDVIHDPGATKANYQAMRRAGLAPVPIFQRGAQLADLDFYYDTADMIGLGGLVHQRGSRPFVNGMMARIRKRRVHWLGFSDPQFVKHYRPYSCDTVSWEAAGRYGDLQLHGADGNYMRIRRRMNGRDLTPRALATIRNLGRDPSLFQFPKAWRGAGGYVRTLGAVTAVAHMRAVHRQLGTFYFAAVVNDNSAKKLLDAWDFLKGQPQ